MNVSGSVRTLARAIGSMSVAVVVASCSVAASPAESTRAPGPAASTSPTTTVPPAASTEWHGLEWLPAAAMPTGGQDFTVASWSGGLIAAQGGQIWTSADGATWEQAAHDPAMTDVLAGVIEAPGGPLAIGLPHPQDCGLSPCPPDFDIWRSTDAVHWTREPDPPFAHQRLGSSFTDGKILLLTSSDENDSTIWSSTDGHSWTGAKIPAVEIDSAARVSSGYVVTGYVRRAASTATGLFLAATKPSTQVAAWSSTDGRSWTRIENYDGPDTVLAGSAGYWGIQVSGPCGTQGSWWHSADGLRWQADTKFGPYGSLEAERPYACGSAMVAAGFGRVATVRSADSGAQTIWISDGDDSWRSLAPTGGSQPEGIRWIRLTANGIIAATDSGLRFGRGV